MIADFKATIENVNPKALVFDRLETLQVNLGNRCNQSCAHCHIGGGPEGGKLMGRPVMEKIIGFLRNHRGLCVDITGGCPELNPDFRFFISALCGLVSRLMVRTNLTVLLEPEQEWAPGWYSENKVALVASLPCYTESNVDKQRGDGVFQKSITALKMLNGLGYGSNEGLELNLVYNPGDGFLPGAQEGLEADYKRELKDKYGISFNQLFTITNAPIGRFRQYLEANGQLQRYLRLLVEKFNPDAADNIMCRRLVSVDYKGVLYNCDFNQALGLPIIDSNGTVATIEQLDEILSGEMKIITGEHCFCCTAGAGSSCTGAIAK